MTSYVDHTLVPGERIICSAHYHWFYWAKHVLGYIIFLGLAILIGQLAHIPFFPAIIGVFCALDFCFAYLLYVLDEMVITTHRVVFKTGIISRDVFEMQISKVETVLVDQTFLGRVFDYGLVACRGTGGTMSKSIQIASPLQFRAAFQNAVKESQSGNIRTEVASALASVVTPASGDATLQRLDEIIRLLNQLNSKLDAAGHSDQGSGNATLEP